MSVADGVGHGLFGLSQSLAQCSVVNARRLLRFGGSMPIDAGFQISIYADSTCVGGCVKGDFWLAPEQAKPDTFGELGTLLRRSGPENAFRPLLILHRSAGGRRKSPKKTQTRLGISAYLCSLCTRIAYNLLRTCRASRFANNCAAALAARGRGTAVTRSPASRRKLHAAAARRSHDPPDRHGLGRSRRL